MYPHAPISSITCFSLQVTNEAAQTVCDFSLLKMSPFGNVPQCKINCVKLSRVLVVFILDKCKYGNYTIHMTLAPSGGLYVP